jgi:hypothetical protein
VTDAPEKKAGWFAVVVQKRSRRGWWAYVIWLVVYVWSAMYFLGDTGTDVSEMWPFLIPIGIVILQLIRPTLLVWAVISLPTFVYFAVPIYYIIVNNIGPHPQWKDDSEGVILGAVFLTALFGLCVALIFAFRRIFHAPASVPKPVANIL